MIPWWLVWIIGILILLFIVYMVLKDFIYADAKTRKKLGVVWGSVAILGIVVYIIFNGSIFADNLQTEHDTKTAEMNEMNKEININDLLKENYFGAKP